MAMMVTTMETLRGKLNEKGWKMYCLENEMDPNDAFDPEEHVAVDSFDLMRYGAAEEALSLRESVRAFLSDSLSD